MKAIIYARISTDKEKQNIQQQIEYCKKWAEREGYNVVKVFKDEGSGRKSDRRGYIRMQEYLKNNSEVILIVQDTDRITRDFYDGVEFERFIIENNIKLKSLSENIDLQSPNGRFMWRIKLAMNCFYVDNLIHKIGVGIERAKKEGKFKGRKRGSKNKKLFRRNRKYKNNWDI